MSIKFRSNANVSDRYPIEVDPGIFAISDPSVLLSRFPYHKIIAYTYIMDAFDRFRHILAGRHLFSINVIWKLKYIKIMYVKHINWRAELYLGGLIWLTTFLSRLLLGHIVPTDGPALLRDGAHGGTVDCFNGLGLVAEPQVGTMKQFRSTMITRRLRFLCCLDYNINEKQK